MRSVTVVLPASMCAVIPVFRMLSRSPQATRLGGLSVEGYGPFIQEPQEIGLKTWLGGGRVKIHRGTWYAHWRKREGQGYVLSPRQSREGLLYSTDYWMRDRWPDRVHDMRWLIEQFSPVPGWPETW